MNVEEYIKECRLCPRQCKINRLTKKGFCGAGDKIIISKVQLHYFEEPCISGTDGSGTIFFAGCNMRCKFCQNYKISNYNGFMLQSNINIDNSGNIEINKKELINNKDNKANNKRNIEDQGKNSITSFAEYTIEQLANTMIDLQNQKAHNINLVTGFMYVPQIICAIDLAREKGLNIPIVYNSSGYESVDTIKMLEGYIDVYLPDFKYYYNELAKRLSGVDNYFEIASSAILQMVHQVGKNEFDENGIIKNGVIIRHLIFPNHLQNTKQVLKFIRKNFGKDAYISIMSQYFPEYKAKNIDDINRKLSADEYNEILIFVNGIGFTKGFFQEYKDEDESIYVPDF